MNYTLKRHIEHVRVLLPIWKENLWLCVCPAVDVYITKGGKNPKGYIETFGLNKSAYWDNPVERCNICHTFVGTKQTSAFLCPCAALVQSHRNPFRTIYNRARKTLEAYDAEHTTR